MAAFRSLDDVAVGGKTVLVRVDLNVPVQDGQVSDRTRIDRVAPTLRELANKGARVVVMSHFARPKGKVVPSMSLAPLAAHISRALADRPVVFASDCVGAEARTAVAGLGDSDVLLLENLRFHAGEERNDPEFVAALAELGDVFVNDAFSTAHRTHASTVGIASSLPAVAGRLMQAELKAFDKALGHPTRPVAAVVGGAKVSTKLEVLDHLVGKVDRLVIGGGMANTFLHARGVAVGRSLCEADLADQARAIWDHAEAAGCEMFLPRDAVTATRFAADAPRSVMAIDRIGPEDMILDIGPDSIVAFGECFDPVRTVVWNGPLGAFEIEGFDAGTVAAARDVARRTRDGQLVSVAGGGDTVAALSHAGVAADFTYVSTAGGAFLEWLEGKTLPGVAALAASGDDAEV